MCRHSSARQALIQKIRDGAMGDIQPVSAHCVGGRFAGSADASQNLDSSSLEYTFADGTKARVTRRYIPKCHTDFATFVHGTRCAAKFSGDVHAPT